MMKSGARVTFSTSCLVPRTAIFTHPRRKNRYESTRMSSGGVQSCAGRGAYSLRALLLVALKGRPRKLFAEEPRTAAIRRITDESVWSRRGQPGGRSSASYAAPARDGHVERKDSRVQVAGSERLACPHAEEERKAPRGSSDARGCRPPAHCGLAEAKDKDLVFRGTDGGGRFGRTSTGRGGLLGLRPASHGSESTTCATKRRAGFWRPGARRESFKSLAAGPPSSLSSGTRK